MTNEELAVLIQSGDKTRFLELWEQVKRFTWKQAQRKIRALDGRRGVEVDDLVQAGFIALVDTVRCYDASAGFAFMTLYGIKLKAAFQMATGCRTERQRREPIDNAISIETPLTDEENADVLGDLIPDPAAELAFDEIAENDRLRRLHDALEDALSTLPSEQADALRMKYFAGCSADAKACQKRLRALRHPHVSKGVRMVFE